MTRDHLEGRRQPGGRPDRRGRLRQGCRLPAAQGHRPRRVLGRQRPPGGGVLPGAVGLHPGRLQRSRDEGPRPGQLRHGPERHPLRVHGAADAGRRDRRARPRATATASTTSRSRSTTSQSAWRETTSRGAVSALEPTELDGGEDGILRRSSIHTYGEVLHSFVDRSRLPGVFAPGYRKVKSPAARRGRAVAARGRPLRRQRRARPDGRVRRLLPRRPRLRPAHPLRRQGHPHRVLAR